MRDRCLLRFACVGALFVLGVLSGGTAHAAPEFYVEESAVQCFDVIGAAPELREMARRTAKTDPGKMSAFVVRVGDTVVADIRAAFDDISASTHDGFDQTRGGAIAFASTAPGVDVEAGATTKILPRDGYLMFTMADGVVDHIRSQRPRCGARQSFDKAPFVTMHRNIRGTLRGMLDQERR
ncbi:MAG: hypothetical protein HOL07_15530 [Rhodospirillaceae bacterium]|jgi:hypothetical protein|nr:hypothetical protein [Rhodospirillaceae bacterium]MBT7362286.1 hypothetical protein [Rhodospirillaceae bacterium]